MRQIKKEYSVHSDWELFVFFNLGNEMDKHMLAMKKLNAILPLTLNFFKNPKPLKLKCMSHFNKAKCVSFYDSMIISEVMFI